MKDCKDQSAKHSLESESPQLINTAISSWAVMKPVELTLPPLQLSSTSPWTEWLAAHLSSTWVAKLSLQANCFHLKILRLSYDFCCFCCRTYWSTRLAAIQTTHCCRMPCASPRTSCPVLMRRSPRAGSPWPWRKERSVGKACSVSDSVKCRYVNLHWAEWLMCSGALLPNAKIGIRYLK